MPNETPPRPSKEDWDSLNRRVEQEERADKKAREEAKARSDAEIEANLLLSKLGVGVKSQAASPPADSTSTSGNVSSQRVDLDLTGNDAGGGGRSGGGGRKSGGGGSGGKPFNMDDALEKYFPRRVLGILLVAAGLFALFINLRVEDNRAHDSDPVKLAREKTAQLNYEVQLAKEKSKQQATVAAAPSGMNLQKNPCIVELGDLKGRGGYPLLDSCGAIVFVPSSEYPLARFVPPWPLKRAEGTYALFDQGDGPLLCQTENAANPLYSSKGCQEVLEKIVFPRQIKIARMTTSVTIIPR